MPIHYERDDEHIVRITIDRPEARNSADMEHFKQLRMAWERFDDDADAWVAIITGVGDAFFTGADLKTYVPEITKVAERIQNEGLSEIDGYRLDDGTKSVLRGAKIWKPIIAAVNGFCTAGGMEMLGRRRHPRRVPGSAVRGDGAQARLVRRRRHDGATPAPDPVPAGDGVPPVRRPHPGPARLRDGAAERDRSSRATARQGLRVRAPHHRQRAARGAGDEAERVGGSRHEPARRVQERERSSAR